MNSTFTAIQNIVNKFTGNDGFKLSKESADPLKFVFDPSTINTVSIQEIAHLSEMAAASGFSIPWPSDSLSVMKLWSWSDPQLVPVAGGTTPAPIVTSLVTIPVDTGKNAPNYKGITPQDAFLIWLFYAWQLNWLTSPDDMLTAATKTAVLNAIPSTALPRFVEDAMGASTAAIQKDVSDTDRKRASFFYSLLKGPYKEAVDMLLDSPNAQPLTDKFVAAGFSPEQRRQYLQSRFVCYAALARIVRESDAIEKIANQGCRFFNIPVPAADGGIYGTRAAPKKVLLDAYRKMRNIPASIPDNKIQLPAGKIEMRDWIVKSAEYPPIKSSSGGDVWTVILEAGAADDTTGINQKGMWGYRAYDSIAHAIADGIAFDIMHELETQAGLGVRNLLSSTDANIKALMAPYSSPVGSLLEDKDITATSLKKAAETVAAGIKWLADMKGTTPLISFLNNIPRIMATQSVVAAGRTPTISSLSRYINKAAKPESVPALIPYMSASKNTATQTNAFSITDFRTDASKSNEDASDSNAYNRSNRQVRDAYAKKISTSALTATEEALAKFNVLLFAEPARELWQKAIVDVLAKANINIETYVEQFADITPASVTSGGGGAAGGRGFAVAKPKQVEALKGWQPPLSLMTKDEPDLLLDTAKNWEKFQDLASADLQMATPFVHLRFVDHPLNTSERTLIKPPAEDDFERLFLQNKFVPTDPTQPIGDEVEDKPFNDTAPCGLRSMRYSIERIDNTRRGMGKLDMTFTIFDIAKVDDEPFLKALLTVGSLFELQIAYMHPEVHAIMPTKSISLMIREFNSIDLDSKGVLEIGLVASEYTTWATNKATLAIPASIIKGTLIPNISKMSDTARGMSGGKGKSKIALACTFGCAVKQLTQLYQEEATRNKQDFPPLATTFGYFNSMAGYIGQDTIKNAVVSLATWANAMDSYVRNLGTGVTAHGGLYADNKTIKDKKEVNVKKPEKPKTPEQLLTDAYANERSAIRFEVALTKLVGAAFGDGMYLYMRSDEAPTNMWQEQMMARGKPDEADKAHGMLMDRIGDVQKKLGSSAIVPMIRYEIKNINNSPTLTFIDIQRRAEMAFRKQLGVSIEVGSSRSLVKNLKISMTQPGEIRDQALYSFLQSAAKDRLVKEVKEAHGAFLLDVLLRQGTCSLFGNTFFDIYYPIILWGPPYLSRILGTYMITEVELVLEGSRLSTELQIINMEVFNNAYQKS